jgi:hypothetical protein
MVTPLNYIVVANLRANDILLLSSVAVFSFSRKMSKTLALAVTAVAVLLLITTLSGLLLGLEFRVERAVFIYKYFLVVLVPGMFIQVLSSQRRIRRLMWVLLLPFLFLSGWVYFYRMSVTSGSLSGVDRVSFPGSESNLVSDAHLYANYLSIILLGYLLFVSRKLGHGALTISAVSLFSLGAIALTGSRNGLLTMSFGLVVYGALSAIYGRRIRFRGFLKSGAIVALVSVSTIVLANKYIAFAGDLLIRALNFSLFQDQSSIGRVTKLASAIDSAISTNVVLGGGVFGAPLTWYDGLLGILIAQFGFLGLAFWAIMFFVVVAVQLRIAPITTRGGRAALTLTLTYLLGNLVTEFSLVTRSMLPTLALICVVLAEASRADLIPKAPPE